MTGDRSQSPVAVDSEAVAPAAESEEAGSRLGGRIFAAVVLNLLLGLFVNWDRSYASVLVAMFVAPVLNVIAFVLGITADPSPGRGLKAFLREKGAFVLASIGAVGLFYLFFSSVKLVGC